MKRDDGGTVEQPANRGAVSNMYRNLESHVRLVAAGVAALVAGMIILLPLSAVHAGSHEQKDPAHGDRDDPAALVFRETVPAFLQEVWWKTSC